MERSNRHIIRAFIAVDMVLIATVFVFTRAPIEREMREVQKIFYFHVGFAWTMFIAFLVTAVAGVFYLVKRRPRADAIAGASAEIGFVYASIVLATGMLWARSAWNTWWNWEPRLTSTLVLWLIYAAYLLFRASTRGDMRRRYSSVFGIIACVMVPIVYFSIHLWGSLLHPPTTTARSVAPMMMWGMLLGAVTMIAMYVYLLYLRADVEEMERAIDVARHDALDRQSGEVS